MYAVIRTGGKQCRVRKDDLVRVETLGGEVGSSITFEEVLAIGEGDDVRVGTPAIDGASVRGTIVRHGRAKKIVRYTYKPRQNSNRKRGGHRQNFSEVRIDAIEG